MKGKNAGNDQIPYKMKMQKQGISEPGIKSGIPMKATPITPCNPGLGATTIAHPFKNGKPKI
jgi:hypothetical protein